MTEGIYCLRLENIIHLTIIYTLIYHVLTEIFTIPNWVDTYFGDKHQYIPFIAIMIYWLGTTSYKLYNRKDVCYYLKL